MLKGIDPLLTPALLQVLAAMGHGDEIVIADANFTARSLARRADGAVPVIDLAGAGVLRTCEAVMSLLPLDAAVACPVTLMQVCDRPAGWRSALQRALVERFEDAGWARAAQVEAVERFAFYDRVRGAQAIVLTGELQPYANVILKKGVISEPLAA